MTPAVLVTVVFENCGWFSKTTVTRRTARISAYFQAWLIHCSNSIRLKPHSVTAMEGGRSFPLVGFVCALGCAHFRFSAISSWRQVGLSARATSRPKHYRYTLPFLYRRRKKYAFISTSFSDAGNFTSRLPVFPIFSDVGNLHPVYPYGSISFQTQKALRPVYPFPSFYSMWGMNINSIRLYLVPILI